MRMFIFFLSFLCLAAGVASASPLSYDFRAPAGTITCRAPSSGATVPGGPAPRDCNAVEVFQPIGGGLPVSISAIPSASASPVGGLNVFEQGIGVGGDSGGASLTQSPGGARVSAGPTASQFWSTEYLRMEWDLPVMLSELRIGSVGPVAVDQALAIFDSGGNMISGALRFRTGSAAYKETVFTFEVPLVGSSFVLAPIQVLYKQDNVAGFYLTGATVKPVPVPPALPLLGGAIALLAWRARARRMAGA